MKEIIRAVAGLFIYNTSIRHALPIVSNHNLTPLIFDCLALSCGKTSVAPYTTISSSDIKDLRTNFGYHSARKEFAECLTPLLDSLLVSRLLDIGFEEAAL